MSVLDEILDGVRADLDERRAAVPIDALRRAVEEAAAGPRPAAGARALPVSA